MIKTATLLKSLLTRAYTNDQAESQFAIDWLERITDIELPDGVYQDSDYVNSTLYEVDNILEIFDKSHPDYAFFLEVKGWLEDMYQHA